MSKPTPLSYSRLSTFENCPASFDYQHISKLVSFQGSDATEYGNRVHKVLEELGNGELNEAALSDEGRTTLDKWGPLVHNILSRSGEKLFEQQLAVNDKLAPVDWFAADVWIRSIADVLVIDGTTAYLLDWKTGKVRDNPTQMQLFAAMVMWHYPEVTTVHTAFIWLRFDETTKATYERRFLSALWGALKPRFDKVQDTIDLGVFDAKPSGLCPWCPAKEICPNARIGRR